MLAGTEWTVLAHPWFLLSSTAVLKPWEAQLPVPLLILWMLSLICIHSSQVVVGGQEDICAMICWPGYAISLPMYHRLWMAPLLSLGVCSPLRIWLFSGKLMDLSQAWLEPDNITSSYWSSRQSSDIKAVSLGSLERTHWITVVLKSSWEKTNFRHKTLVSGFHNRQRKVTDGCSSLEGDSKKSFTLNSLYGIPHFSICYSERLL